MIFKVGVSDTVLQSVVLSYVLVQAHSLLRTVSLRIHVGDSYSSFWNNPSSITGTGGRVWVQWKKGNTISTAEPCNVTVFFPNRYISLAPYPAET